MTQDPATPGGAVPDPTRDAATHDDRGRPAANEQQHDDPQPAGVPGALAELEGLDDIPVGEHVERFARVHDFLRARLDGEPEPGERGDAGPGTGPAR
ncbi:hypothetical protein [Isoptericola sp. NPDC057191]|uniref:hypothetical protein n=1 Tax=Isoptericola sp. NPDC057191 TaxID=3346041 RepID=UPI00363D6376